MDTESENQPPSADRVLRRARVLAAIAHRGLIEQDRDRDRARGVLAQIRRWIGNEGLHGELEPEERARIESDVGALGAEATVAAVWRFEGAAVLGWALGLMQLPPHDRVNDVGAVSTALAVGGSLPEALRAPTLRSARSIDRMRERLFAIHWRVVEQRLRPGTIDLVAFARTAWFGPLEVDSSMLVDGDLGIDGAPIARASADALRRVTAIARERHQAINWLNGDDPIYSEVDVST
ncbi:DUF4272 domain-containing protein [Sandaracinus amylolyticus]|uniref:DUF4272 domain-containing protein n=1 Tax=Sandaracinus amylolyticus TaxID=927083 RepID=UPI001F3CCA4B|nr:DUF4272 domain-containing protein [Sandaracinus amylolyticus]UJR86282.1 Hypothetical protein I5071_83660 [Sandaracinus amylolyticus]